MNKKRVILIRNANHFDFGGGERFPIFLADILQKNSYEVTVVSRSEKLLSFAKDDSIKTIKGWWWSQQNWSGPRTLLFPLYVAWQSILLIWYLQIFIRVQPEVIHIQSKDDFIAATLAGKLLGKRIIWTDHADLKHIWKNVRVWHKNPIGKLVYIAALFTDIITVVSKSERALIEKNLDARNIVSQKIEVVYNGAVDTNNAYGSNKTNDDFTFCVASRLVTDKGIGEVIESFIKLTDTHSNCRLVFLGDGPESEKFKKQAQQNSKIIFLGHQQNPLPLIATSDVFVHPTYHEGFSVALVEASMLARPIIATAVGGNIEIIEDHKTGILVPAKDSESLYLAMKLLIESEPLRLKLGGNARKQFKAKFNFTRIVKNKFIPLYDGYSS